jgi:hypothetical protein
MMDTPRSRRGRNVAIIAGLACLGILLVSLLHYGFNVRQMFQHNPNRGQRVMISRGEIPVMDFVRFLSDYTGYPAIVSDDVDSQAVITIANDFPDADEEIVKAIFEVNRLRVVKQALPSGRTVLKIESMGPNAPRRRVMPKLRSRSESERASVR